MSIRNKHARDYRLIDVMGGSAKPEKCKSTKVYQRNRLNQHSNKQKCPCFDDVITEEARCLVLGLIIGSRCLFPQKP